MANKPTLSREYLFFPLAGLNVDIANLTVHRVAFTDAGVEPTDPDWLEAIVVDDQHALYNPDIGESLAILVGPDRGDVVTTEDLTSGDYQTWVEATVTGSDERVVRVAGTFTVSATGGA